MGASAPFHAVASVKRTASAAWFFCLDRAVTFFGSLKASSFPKASWEFGFARIA